ncbi:hypothetical protein [Streptomyces sp. NPDC057257]|uniref:hypothetical protein n=1 Tax=Streptomyces sp. NPDC057257 TaxID=3346071 RepID=UPI00362F05D3
MTKARVIQVPSVAVHDEQARKQGVWYTDRMQAATWHLAPGQRIVAHCHPEADSLLSVISGTGEYFVYEDEEPNPSVCYVSEPDVVVVPPPPGDPGTPKGTAVGPGSLAFTPAGRFYGLVNNGTEPVIALAVTAADPSHSVYTVRMPVRAAGHGGQ